MSSLSAIIQNYLMNDQYWTWWAIAILLLVAEILLPSAWLIWPAIAAFGTGLIALFLPLEWELQIVIFVMLSLLTTLLGRRYFKAYYMPQSSNPTLNNRLANLIGRKGQSLDDSVDEYNRIRLDDTVWRVKSINHQAVPKGAFLEVTAEENGILLVQVIE